MQKLLVELRQLSVKPTDFLSMADSAPILKDISLKLVQGEWVTLIGPNGSGKSTLAKVLAGLHHDGVEGEVRHSQHECTSGGAVGSVPMVLQQPDAGLIGSTPWEDVVMMLEEFGADEQSVIEQAEAALRRVGLGCHMHQPIETLSGGQKQLTAIAGCLAVQAPMLILDEVTAMLSPDAASLVLQRIRALNRSGMTVVWLTQKLEECMPSDRLIVMEAGSIAYDDKAGSWEQDFAADAVGRLVSSVVGNTLDAAVGRPLGCVVGNTLDDAVGQVDRLLDGSHGNTLDKAVAPIGDSVDSCPDWHLSHVTIHAEGKEQASILEDVNFTFRAGEITLLIGENGAGKSTLLESLAGLRRLAGGAIELGQAPLWLPVHRRSMRKDSRKLNRAVMLKLGIALQHSEAQWFATTVREELQFSMQPYGMEEHEAQESMEAAMLDAGLSLSLLDRDPWSLSGGQQRRLSLACLLACKPDWLLLDEPTAGLDADGMERLCAVLRAQSGRARCGRRDARPRSASAAGDRIAVVSGGSVRAAAPAAACEAAAAEPSQTQHEQQRRADGEGQHRVGAAAQDRMYDPRALIAAYMLLSSGVLAQSTLAGLGLAALTAVLLLMPFRQHLRPWFGLMRAMALLTIILCLISGLSLAPFTFDYEKIYPVAVRLGGLFVLMLLGMPLLELMTPFRLQRAIEHTFGWLNRFKLPIQSFSLLVTVIFRFIPLLMAEWKRFAKLVHARGKADSPLQAVPLRLLRPMLLPYMRSILRLAEQMANALEARGIGGARRSKTIGYRLKLRRRDAILAGIAALGSTILWCAAAVF